MAREKHQPAISEYILKQKTGFEPEKVAEQLGVGLKEVKDVLDFLQDSGYVFAHAGNTYIRSKTNAERSNFDARRMFNRGLLHFGLVSDTHLGSKNERLDALNRMYDIFQSEGVGVVFHVGDWTDGVGVYRGQENEVHTYGQEDQIKYTIDHYPHRSGIQTVGITGNHDLKQYERGGVDPMTPIARARRDITYIGQYSSRVRMADKVTMELLHPLGNVAYALSYRAQREINNRAPDNLPNILAHGHFHTSFYMRYRGIDFIQVPCFKDQGHFERRLGLGPTIGGWIVTGKTDGEVVYQMDPNLRTFGGSRR